MYPSAHHIVGLQSLPLCDLDNGFQSEPAHVHLQKSWEYAYTHHRLYTLSAHFVPQTKVLLSTAAWKHGGTLPPNIWTMDGSCGNIRTSPGRFQFVSQQYSQQVHRPTAKAFGHWPIAMAYGHARPIPRLFSMSATCPPYTQYQDPVGPPRHYQVASSVGLCH